ncbi:hypothetical protein SISSUDRAFT_994863 [Sistotremastrum suecicum HHB10207 ss-3]|uniref:Uncharacterized protein n=1 Tax=Sistotremastrum suecicum HHB10207 ss-3 TaxID=1314776 RepID=A0A165WXN2_9AGAM|nr:hypothetical protein SISSUDRAFT_994863 [Sistotremastrum suecicum HHB10207 ss-3]
MKDLILKSRKQSSDQFAKEFAFSIKDYDFKPGRLVLVRNSGAETDLGRKWKPRYLGPYVVIARHSGGSYTLAELDGTISKLRFAAKRIIPYFLRTSAIFPEPNSQISDASLEQELDS